MKTKIATAVVISAIALPAFALNSTARIDTRQANQDQRIEAGVRSGQLNWREAQRLRQGQAQIRRMERNALADGRLSPREQARIEAAQDRQSRLIGSERHDRQASRW